MRPAALLLPIFLLANTAIADEPAPRTITTTGTATIHVVPDEAAIQFSIHTFDADLLKSKKLNDDATAEVLAFLKSLGIEAKDIQTAAATSSAVYEYRQEYNRQVRGPIVGYDVTREYGIKLRDLTKLDSVYDKLLPDSRVTLQTLSLSTSESRKHRDQARLDAVKAAKEKAQALAGALDMRVSMPRQISESSGYRPFTPGFAQAQSFANSNRFDGGGAGGSDASPVGQIEVEAQVTVTFDIEPKPAE